MVKKVVILLLVFLVYGCANKSAIKPNDLKKLQPTKENYAYLYGTYRYVDRDLFYTGAIGIAFHIVPLDNKNEKEFFLSMIDKDSDFLYNLTPGKYKIIEVGYLDVLANRFMDYKKVNYTLEINSNTVYYIGSFDLMIKNQYGGIGWGINEIVDNYENDTNILIKKYDIIRDSFITNICLK